MQIYLAAPLFSQAERDWLDRLAETLRAEGLDCFVPHEHFDEVAELTPQEIYRIDGNGLRASNVLLAWLDGPMVDDGTAAASDSSFQPMFSKISRSVHVAPFSSVAIASRRSPKRRSATIRYNRRTSASP